MSGDAGHALSDDARVVAAAWFGLMTPGEGTLSFSMREHRPSPRAQAGLDELVEKGVAVREDGPSGSVVYRPLVPCSSHLAWAERRGRAGDEFRLVDRVTPGRRPLRKAGVVTFTMSEVR